jgi:hypothetical protein
MNKTQLSKAVRDVVADLSLSGTPEQDRIAKAFDYLADLIDAIEDEVPEPEIECETPAELNFVRWGGARDIYRVWLGESMVGLIEKLDDGKRWKAVTSGGSHHSTRRSAASHVLRHYESANRP